MKFEWYSEKERINIEKHGIDLRMVKEVLDDPFHVEQYDEAHSGLEDRWQVLGKPGEPEERRIYYGESNKGNWFIP